MTYLLGGMLYFGLCVASFVFVSAARMNLWDEPPEAPPLPESDQSSDESEPKHSHRESLFSMNINGMR